MDNKNHILELSEINKSFFGNHIHRGINLKLYAGESLGLLGGSGTGKSVLLRSIVGLEHIDSGQISYRGQRMDHLDENQLVPFRKKVSYSFQSGALFDSLNVYENLAYPLLEHTNLKEEEINKKIHEMLALIDLPNKEKLMPADLSGGMQKRVGMARALILEPEVILYDEPTAGLDPNNTKNILALMEKLKVTKNLASIFVTHDIPAALKVCDRIVILDKGVIGFSGTPEDLISSEDPMVKKYFIHQFENV